MPSRRGDQGQQIAALFLITLGLTGFFFGFGSLSGLFGCPWMLDHLAMRHYGESLAYTAISNGVGLFFATITAVGIHLLRSTLRYKVRENQELARRPATNFLTDIGSEGSGPRTRNPPGNGCGVG